VPNVSEGRRPEVIAQLREAIAGALGGACCVLDVHSDPDHNRSVITFVGAPGAVAVAVLRLAAAAVELIDMRQHEGVHPRIGALDVVPFVPLAGCEMADCTELAEATGRHMAANQGVPVYLYGEAAPPGRPTRLVDLRRGGFEALASAAVLPLAPDFGPPAAHPTAGATAVGSREILVAFNLVLDTADVAVAQRVARSVRESSGGLPGVQALGILLPARGLAQVTTNLLDAQKTPLRTLVEAVMAGAAREGVSVAEAELVGLAPASVIESLAGLDLPGMPTAADSIEARLARCAG
jgi:glutamate formiminotransferase